MSFQFLGVGQAHEDTVRGAEVHGLVVQHPVCHILKPASRSQSTVSWVFSEGRGEPALGRDLPV